MQSYDRRKRGLPLLILAPVVMAVEVGLPFVLHSTGTIGDWERTCMMSIPLGRRVSLRPGGFVF